MKASYPVTAPPATAANIVKKSKKRQRICADESAKFTNSNCVPTKLSTALRWTDKVHSSNIPTVAFTYEVTFPTSIIKHLKLKIQLLLNSDLRYCAITEVKTFLSEVIQPGDLLLSINRKSLLYLAKEDDPTFDSGEISSIITEAGNHPPCMVRIMRLGAMTPNFRPSPVEIALLQADEKCTAKFVVNIPDKKKDKDKGEMDPSVCGGGSNSSSSAAKVSPSIELRYLAADAPLSIKKMMQGVKMQWDYFGHALPVVQTPSMPSTAAAIYSSAAEAASSVLSYAPPLPVVETTSIQTFISTAAAPSNYNLQAATAVMKDDDGLVWGGLFRFEGYLRNRCWGVYMGEKISCGGQSDSQERIHHLGCRYDTEAEARAAYNKAAEEVRNAGFFSQKRFVRSMEKPEAPRAPALTLPLGSMLTAGTLGGADPQQQQQTQYQYQYQHQAAQYQFQAPSGLMQQHHAVVPQPAAQKTTAAAAAGGGHGATS